MEDEREEEMNCIAAIFPETTFDPKDPFSASLELPVHPQIPVKVIFPVSSDGVILPTPPASINSQEEGEVAEPANRVESHDLSYLPSIQLRITLPEGYPNEKPPQFEITTTPPWLSEQTLEALQTSGVEMWEEAGRSLVVYGFIDSVQQAAENAFGFGEEGKVLEVPQDFKISLLDYDIQARRAAFEKETFDCGVCLDPKKGTVCHRMVDCGHVFCVQCLQDFYNNAITTGDLNSVRCLAPDCAKKRSAEQIAKRKRPKVQLSPSELLQIPLQHDVVTRYVKLKHKAELESDRNTVYCPRKWCQGAAKSEKHRKPEGLEDTDSGDDSDEEGKPTTYVSGKDLLSICEDCSFAFCSRCYQGWHGELTICVPQMPTGELTAEDKASLEYLSNHSTPCPTCSARAQKTHGCNHMICFKCNSHFCYLCSSWLEASNPYKHYNQPTAYCYMRLWELEAGDGDDADRQRGAQNLQNEMQQANVIAHAPPVVLEEPIAIQPPIEEPAPEPANEPDIPQAAHQREGPLVLRINAAPRPQPAILPINQPPNHAPRRGNRNRGNGPQIVRHNHPAIQRNPNRIPNRRQAVPAPDPAEQEEAQQAWVQMFVQMALNDEEDQVDWDSDDEHNARWEIPVR